jgi:hypothetical protein
MAEHDIETKSVNHGSETHAHNADVIAQCHTEVLLLPLAIQLESEPQKPRSKLRLFSVLIALNVSVLMLYQIYNICFTVKIN